MGLFKRRKHYSRDSNPLTRIRCRFSDQDHIDGRMACTHFLITGQTGSSKTEGSGSLLLNSSVRADDGLMVLGSKSGESGEAARVLRFARACGREEDVEIVRADGKHRIDALHHIFEVSGSSYVSTCSDFLTTMLRIGKRRSGAGSADPFWEDSTSQLNKTLLVWAGMGGKVSLPFLAKMLASMPRSPDQLASESFRESSLAYQTIARAEVTASKDQASWQQYEMSLDYLRQWVHLPDRTRESININWTASYDHLLREPLLSAISSGPTTITPEETHTGDNKILVIDVPSTKDQGQSSKFLNATWKYLWQLSVLNRDIEEDSPITTLFVDEASEFFFPESDGRFMRLARGFRGSCIFLTQSVTDFSGIVDGSAAQAQVDSLLDNMAIKIGHACVGETALYLSKLIGTREIMDGTWNRGENYGDDGENRSNHGFSMKREDKPVVPPHVFQTLKMGWPEPVSEAVVFQSGRRFLANRGESYLIVKFTPDWALR